MKSCKISLISLISFGYLQFSESNAQMYNYVSDSGYDSNFLDQRWKAIIYNDKNNQQAYNNRGKGFVNQNYFDISGGKDFGAQYGSSNKYSESREMGRYNGFNGGTGHSKLTSYLIKSNSGNSEIPDGPDYVLGSDIPVSNTRNIQNQDIDYDNHGNDDESYPAKSIETTTKVVEKTKTRTKLVTNYVTISKEYNSDAKYNNGGTDSYPSSAPEYDFGNFGPTRSILKPKPTSNPNTFGSAMGRDPRPVISDVTFNNSFGISGPNRSPVNNAIDDDVNGVSPENGRPMSPNVNEQYGSRPGPPNSYGNGPYNPYQSTYNANGSYKPAPPPDNNEYGPQTPHNSGPRTNPAFVMQCFTVKSPKSGYKETGRQKSTNWKVKRQFDGSRSGGGKIPEHSVRGMMNNDYIYQSQEYAINNDDKNKDWLVKELSTKHGSVRICLVTEMNNNKFSKDDSNFLAQNFPVVEENGYEKIPIIYIIFNEGKDNYQPDKPSNTNDNDYQIVTNTIKYPQFVPYKPMPVSYDTSQTQYTPMPSPVSSYTEKTRISSKRGNSSTETIKSTQITKTNSGEISYTKPTENKTKSTQITKTNSSEISYTKPTETKTKSSVSSSTTVAKTSITYDNTESYPVVFTTVTVDYPGLQEIYAA
ncbi:hypothetical protein AYI69_g3551 [Smittium culicis]|uniref:Uncharacterized protein n=1 Tax=Smittium culicis TaxID=133412 RepID=A0A1R1YJE3_9FUNG|nr:hypothetical protein AYI69_g3551 [Smittium culicis]